MNKVIQNITKSINDLPKKMNTGKIDTNFKDLLHNRVILYAFVFITLLDLFYFAQIRDNMSIAVFVLVAFITTFFSKNMIVVLCIALVVTHILKFGVRTVSEGFAEGVDDDEDDEKKEGLENEDDEKEREGLENKEEEEVEGLENEEVDKKDLEEFQLIQEKILGGMKEIDPLLTKAEGFIQKYSHLMQQ
jgi:hypothetical protein